MYYQYHVACIPLPAIKGICRTKWMQVTRIFHVLDIQGRQSGKKVVVGEKFRSIIFIHKTLNSNICIVIHELMQFPIAQIHITCFFYLVQKTL